MSKWEEKLSTYWLSLKGTAALKGKRSGFCPLHTCICLSRTYLGILPICEQSSSIIFEGTFESLRHCSCSSLVPSDSMGPCSAAMLLLCPRLDIGGTRTIGSLVKLIWRSWLDWARVRGAVYKIPCVGRLRKGIKSWIFPDRTVERPPKKEHCSLRLAWEMITWGLSSSLGARRRVAKYTRKAYLPIPDFPMMKTGFLKPILYERLSSNVARIWS